MTLMILLSCLLLSSVISVRMEMNTVPLCTVDQLLPGQLGDAGISDEWSWDDIGSEPDPYDCTCASMKSRYFCPVMSGSTILYPSWTPSAVRDGLCETIEILEDPLPNGFKLLMYGNSHLRQVLDGITCTYEKQLVSKRVSLYEGRIRQEIDVDPERQCRSCGYPGRGDNELLKDQLIGNKCMDIDDVCNCNDDRGEYVFSNGAEIHFHTAHIESNKTMEDSFLYHDTDSFSDYDAVVANSGNTPFMDVDVMIDSAVTMRNENVPFFLA